MRSLSLALVLALSATALSAQNWRDMMKMVDQDLRTQHYAHARKWSIKMINSMSDHLGTGNDSMYTLALTVAYRSMAEAGLKKEDEAHWYWHVANALYPKLAERDWSPYGEVGAWFAAQKSSETPVADLPVAVPVKKAEAKCPLSAINGGYYQSVTVAATVNDDGAPSCPRLVSSTDAPTLVYAALESLKQWEFQPGSGQYQVTMNFAPPRQ